jgi:hypothetical protein
MKKYVHLYLFIILIAFFTTSCLEEYLDKAPESGLTEQAVFTKYENLKKYFDQVYRYNASHYSELPNVYTVTNLLISGFGSLDLDCNTDFCDAGWVSWWQYHKWGPLGDNVWYHFYVRILPPMFRSIRVCNMTIQNIKRLNDGEQDDIDDLMAQAYFIRGLAHFELFKYWGAMPYITNIIGPDDQWDIPRLSKHETLMKVAADMDTAVTYFEKAGKMRRDPLPGQVGHLNAPDQNRPNGVTAKAYKARALLYAASPLNNELGVEDWKAAAAANWEAIQVAEQYGFDLLTAADYKKNYIGSSYTNEQLWAYYYGTVAYNAGILKILINGIFTNSKTTGSSGLNPTQGTVEKWETKWGDPLNTPADREAAAAIGHYNDQDPFVNRDPRFYINIIYNGAPIAGYGTAKIYTETVDGNTVYSELLNQDYMGITHTGYYMRKYWGDQSVKNQIRPQYTCAFIRLGELYLNYAEAANEAYGPKTPAPGASMTAEEAINKIRGRWTADQLAPVQSRFTVSTEAFRPRIKNERTVELAFEGSYYHDIRRWMDAPQAYSGPLLGNIAEKVPVSPEYPSGFKYTRMPLSDDRQIRWLGDKHYYLPFMTEDYYKMKKFDPGQVW